MKPIMRRYKDEADYWRMRQFLREVMLLNELREYSWPVARLDYWRWHGIENCHHCESMEKVTFLWETDAGNLAAALHPEEAGSIFIQIHPDFKSQAMEEELFDVAEEQLSIVKTGKHHLGIWAHADDDLRVGILKSRGFARSGTYENQWRRELDTPIPAAPVAEGYCIRSLGEASEIPARSWASWRGFHPNQPAEKYEGFAWYANIQRCPLYRRDLDILAAAPDGTVAAFSTFWYDDVTRTAMIEPVATVPEHQRRGLARAVITEGLRRVQRMGAVRALVGGMEPIPDGLYSSVLSPEHDLLEEWVKEW